MPIVLRYGAFRFFFYSNEGSPREPVHVHVRLGRDEAKLWLHPEVRVAYNEGFDARTLRDLVRVTEENIGRIEEAWREHFG
jgi:hypothetical protein